MLLRVNSEDIAFIRACVAEHFGGEPIVSLGQAYRMDELQFAFARRDGEPVAFAGYRWDGEDCELVVLVSGAPGAGYGGEVVDQVLRQAKARGCRRVWLVATNDNLHAIGWYQRRGFEMVRVHRRSIERERLLKPNLPQLGLNGIPLRDEIEFEYRLTP